MPRDIRPVAEQVMHQARRLVHEDARRAAGSAIPGGGSGDALEALKAWALLDALNELDELAGKVGSYEHFAARVRRALAGGGAGPRELLSEVRAAVVELAGALGQDASEYE